MHTLSDQTPQAHRVFELKMLFLGLTVLLAMMLVIRFGSPGQRMNAEGTYSPAPMYGVQRYPRPISEFFHSSAAMQSTRLSASTRRAKPVSSVWTQSASSRRPEVRTIRRTTHSPASARSSSAAGRNTRFAPGWFWR